jgi:xanthosine utilization system XapX-like protein
MQIYIHRDNQQLGPFTEAEIKAQLASGAISPQDHVWWEGQQGWVPLGQSPLMAPGFTPSPGTPAAPSVNVITQETSNLAIWALVCGCLSLLLGIFTSIPAIILGHKALSEIKKNPAIQGRSMAKAGMILGYIFTALMVLIPIVAIVVLIALGNQVKDTFKTINAQIAAAQAEQSTNSADQSGTVPDQTTNAPDSSTPAPATTNTPDQSTNSAPATTNSPDSSTNSSTPSTTDSSTNAAPMSQ